MNCSIESDLLSESSETEWTYSCNCVFCDSVYLWPGIHGKTNHIVGFAMDAMVVYAVVYGSAWSVYGSVNWEIPLSGCAALYAAAAVASLCLHYTYLSYMTDIDMSATLPTSS